MATTDDIKAQLTDSESNWLKANKFITGTYQWVFWSKNFINRRDYHGPLPPGVLEERRKVDLYKMAEQMERIEKHTEEISGSFSSFWSGIGQMMAERKAKKEQKNRK